MCNGDKEGAAQALTGADTRGQLEQQVLVVQIAAGGGIGNHTKIGYGERDPSPGLV